MLKYITAALRSLLLGLFCGMYFNLLILYIARLCIPSGYNARITTYIAKKLTHKLIFMGPTWIKLGQFLSTRPDLVGAELAEALSVLQDKLGAFSFSKVKKVMETELGGAIEDVFVEI